MFLNTIVLDTNTQVTPTVATGQKITTISLFLCNTDSTARTVSIYGVPSGGTPGVGNIIMKDLVIPATDTYKFDIERFVLGPGEKIYVVADVTSVITATVSYIIM